MTTNERNALLLWDGKTNSSVSAKYLSTVLDISFNDAKLVLSSLENMGFLQKTYRLTYAITQHGKKILKELQCLPENRK